MGIAICCRFATEEFRPTLGALESGCAFLTEYTCKLNVLVAAPAAARELDTGCEALGILHPALRGEPPALRIHVIRSAAGRVLADIQSQFSGELLHACALDGLAKTCSGWENLVREVPLDVERQLPLCSTHFIWVARTLRCCGTLFALHTDHVGNVIPHIHWLARLHHLQRHLQMGLPLDVRVVTGQLIQPLGDHELLEWNGAGAHICGKCAQLLVDGFDDLIARSAG